MKDTRAGDDGFVPYLRTTIDLSLSLSLLLRTTIDRAAGSVTKKVTWKKDTLLYLDLIKLLLSYTLWGKQQLFCKLPVGPILGVRSQGMLGDY